MIKSSEILNKDIKVEGITDFSKTGIGSFLVKCLQKNDFKEPTPIQYHSITNFIKKPQHYFVAQSKSGTGKTLAFLIPILNDICLHPQNIQRYTICLIILPTRQLSLQVHQYLKQILTVSHNIKAQTPIQVQYKSVMSKLTTLLTIGGIPIQDDKKTLLTTGANLVVGTVGKIYQLMEINSLKGDKIRYVVFDQGDKLFETKDPKLEKIMSRIKRIVNETQRIRKIQILVFSATFTERSMKKLLFKLRQNIKEQPKFFFIQTLQTSSDIFIQKATQNLSELNFVNFQAQGEDNTISTSSELINLENIKKFWIDINEGSQQQKTKSVLNKKCQKLKQILSQINFKRCLIFVEKKALLQQINEQILEFDPLLIHGSLSQASRIKIMNQANQAKIIITSDLLARGIDLLIDLVILYDAQMNQTFWHRIGRTGRFGRIGVVISLDKLVQGWKKYNSYEINSILSQVDILGEGEKPKKKQWYGTYMTQYGQWEEIDAQKEQIINQNYKFFDQNAQEQQEINCLQKQPISKKVKKQLKKISKTSFNNQNQLSSSSQTLSKKYINQAEFLKTFQKIFKCQQCKKHVKNIQSLTNYSFEISKYFFQ